MEDFMTSCVDAYCELAGAGAAASESIDSSHRGGACPTDSFGRRRAGKAQRHSATQSLASRVTKWSNECDASLHRLVSYIHQSKNMFLQGYVGDSFGDCQLWLFADADFAGENDAKSTTGCATIIVVPNTYTIQSTNLAESNHLDVVDQG